jgi:hypothetical protein
MNIFTFDQLKAAHPSPAGQTSALARYDGKDVQCILKV